MKEEEMEHEAMEDLYELQTIEIDKGQTPLRIDKFLQDRLRKVSRNRIQTAIRAGAVKVNGKEMLKSNLKVKPGHKIEILLPRPPDQGKGVIPQDIPLDVRYEDDHILIVHKPPGLVVHPGFGNWDGTLVNGLAYRFKDLPIMEGNTPDRIGLVHRIDKDTSGLLVIAKTDEALTALGKQFFYHTIERKYLALVWGDVEEAQGTITGNIGRHPRHRKQYTVFPEGEEGKWAVTHYRVVERFYYVTLIECELETGRTHQIRVHLKYKGHPLFNDERYGGNRILKGTVYSKYKRFVEKCFEKMPRQALHARSLGFEHPITGEQMFFEADVPEDFGSVLDTWRKYVQSRKEPLL